MTLPLGSLDLNPFSEKLESVLRKHNGPVLPWLDPSILLPELIGEIFSHSDPLNLSMLAFSNRYWPTRFSNQKRISRTERLILRAARYGHMLLTHYLVSPAFFFSPSLQYPLTRGLLNLLIPVFQTNNLEFIAYAEKFMLKELPKGEGTLFACPELLFHAAYGGHSALVEWIVQRLVQIEERQSFYAKFDAKEKHSKAEAFVKKRVPVIALCGFALGGHLQSFREYYKKGGLKLLKGGDFSDLVRYAMASGSIDMADFALKHLHWLDFNNMMYGYESPFIHGALCSKSYELIKHVFERLQEPDIDPKKWRYQGHPIDLAHQWLFIDPILDFSIHIDEGRYLPSGDLQFDRICRDRGYFALDPRFVDFLVDRSYPFPGSTEPEDIPLADILEILPKSLFGKSDYFYRKLVALPEARGSDPLLTICENGDLAAMNPIFAPLLVESLSRVRLTHEIEREVIARVAGASGSKEIFELAIDNLDDDEDEECLEAALNKAFELEQFSFVMELVLQELPGLNRSMISRALNFSKNPTAVHWAFEMLSADHIDGYGPNGLTPNRDLEFLPYDVEDFPWNDSLSNSDSNESSENESDGEDDDSEGSELNASK